MTHCRIITVLFGALLFTSCDKIREIAGGAVSKVSQKVEERMEVVETPKVAGGLQELVDQNEEGVIFRKDLPFPSKIRIAARMEKKIAGRIYHASELGSRVESVNGTEEMVSELELDGATVRYTLKETNFVIPATGEGEDQGPKKIPNPFRDQEPPAGTVAFVQTAKGWKTAKSGDFRAMALSQQLGPVFDELMVANALKPRPLWFSKSRIKIGDEIEVSGNVLPMIVAGNAKGSLKLRLEKIDAVHGHPCGVFSVTGEYSRREFPDFEGRFTDEEVTVESGKMWLSLIHPIILRQELQTIQTFKPSGDGGLVGRGQGSVGLTIELDWQAETVEPKQAPQTPAG